MFSELKSTALTLQSFERLTEPLSWTEQEHQDPITYKTSQVVVSKDNNVLLVL